MRYFTIWCQLITDAIRIDIHNFWSNLSRNHGITRVNHLPDTRDSPRRLLPVHKPPGYFRLLRTIFSFAKSFFSLLVFMVWIDKLEHAWYALNLRLAYI